MRPRLPSGPTAAGWLRRAVVVIAAAYLLVLPQFSTKTTFLVGVEGQPGPVATLLVGLGLWLMPVLLAASWAAEGRVRLPHPLLLAAAGLMVVGAAVSTAAAADKASALVRAAEVTGLWVGAVALAQALTDEGERRFLLAALVAAGVVSAGVAVYQAGIGWPRALDYFEAHREEVLAGQGIEPGGWREQMFRERFFGGVQAALGHPNVLAAMLTLALLAAVGLGHEKWVRGGAGGARGFAGVAFLSAAVCAVGIALTQSRSALAAAAVGVYWLVVARKVRRRRLRVVLLALPLAVGAVGLAVAARVDHPAVASALRTLQYRIDYWRGTLCILASHWMTGVGLENFGSHYIEHKVPWSPENVADPHNMVLSVWSTLGVAGLAALVILWVTAVRAWWRGARAWSSRDRKVAGTHEAQQAFGERDSLADGGPRHLTMAARTSRLEDAEAERGTSLSSLLAPTLALAAAPVVLLFLVGPAWGVAAAAGMAVLVGLLASEDPRRLAVPARPMDRLRTACIVGLLAFALQEQVGTAVLAPPTAWAMLVVLVVTLGGRPDRAGTGRACPERGAAESNGSRSPSPAEGRAPSEGEPRPALPGAGAARTGRARAEAAPSRPLPIWMRFAFMLVAMGLCFAYARYLLVPVAQEGRMLEEAVRAGLDASGAAPARAAAEANPLAWEPAYLEAHLWRQRAAWRRGPRAAMDLERAVEAYRAALGRHPRLRQAHLAMADCYLGLPGAGPDRLEAARAALQEAGRLYPTDVPTRLRLARVLDRLGRTQEAVAAYREVLRLDGLMPAADRRLSAERRAEVRRRLAALRVEAAENGSSGAEPPNSP